MTRSVHVLGIRSSPLLAQSTATAIRKICPVGGVDITGTYADPLRGLARVIDGARVAA